MRNALRVCAVLGWALSSALPVAAQSDAPQGRGANQNPGVIPPHAKYRGLTSGEWAAEWWRAVFAVPVEGGAHPLFTGGAVEGENGIVFMTAPVLPAGSPIAEISVTIPSGTRLFFPLVTVECSVFEDPPFHGDDEASLRACANDLLDLVSDQYAAIDRRPVNNLDAYRVESPLFRWGPLPADNTLGAPEATESDAVAAGFYLMLPPLSVGVHEIIVRAVIDSFGLAVDARFIVTVEPRGQ
jgi:hypothetical protein